MVRNHPRASLPCNAPMYFSARAHASWATSSASAGLRVSQRARLWAASRCGKTSSSKRLTSDKRMLLIASTPRSGDDANRALHVFVPRPTEHVTHKRELADLVGRHRDLGHLTGNDRPARLEVRHAEAHHHVCTR